MFWYRNSAFVCQAHNNLNTSLNTVSVYPDPLSGWSWLSARRWMMSLYIIHYEVWPLDSSHPTLISLFGSGEQGANISIFPLRGNLSAPIDRDNIPQSQCAIYNKACSRSVSDLEKVQRGAEGAYDSCFNSEIFTVHHCSQWKQQNWSATPSIRPPDRPRFIKLAWPIAAVVTRQRGANSAYKYRDGHHRQNQPEALTLLLCWTPDPQDPWQHEGEENAPKVSVGLGGEICLWRDFFPFSGSFVCL